MRSGGGCGDQWEPSSETRDSLSAPFFARHMRFPRKTGVTTSRYEGEGQFITVLRNGLLWDVLKILQLLLVENPGLVCEADPLREAPSWDRNVVVAVARQAGRVDASSRASLSENP